MKRLIAVVVVPAAALQSQTVRSLIPVCNISYAYEYYTGCPENTPCIVKVDEIHHTDCEASWI